MCTQCELNLRFSSLTRIQRWQLHCRRRPRTCGSLLFLSSAVENSKDIKTLEVCEVILINHSSIPGIQSATNCSDSSYNNFCVRSRRISGSWVFPSPKRHHRLNSNCTMRLQSSCFGMSDLRSSKLLNRLQRNFLLEHFCLDV